MTKTKTITELKEEIRPHFKEKTSHGFDHTKRVYSLAVRVAKDELERGEDPDLMAVKLAALLHDVARHKEEIGECQCHAQEGARMARQILKKKGIHNKTIDKICGAIKAHRYTKNIEAKTREAKILQDADRLDALSAVVIGRVFSYGGKMGRPLYDSSIPIKDSYEGNPKTSLHYLYERVLQSSPDSFNTKKAKEIAEERYGFIENFAKKFKEDWKRLCRKFNKNKWAYTLN